VLEHDEPAPPPERLDAPVLVHSPGEAADEEGR
jgi:hypothetical protein